MLCARVRHLALGFSAALGVITGVQPSAAQTYHELTIVGDVLDNGIFDPSVEYLPDGNVGWLTYSSISGDATPWGPKVETHLAKTLDHGETWVFEQKVNASIPGTITLSDGVTMLDGFWNYEVASLAYDPDDAGSECSSHTGSSGPSTRLPRYFRITCRSSAGSCFALLRIREEPGRRRSRCSARVHSLPRLTRPR